MHKGDQGPPVLLPSSPDNTSVFEVLCHFPRLSLTGIGLYVQPISPPGPG